MTKRFFPSLIFFLIFLLITLNIKAINQGVITTIILWYHNILPTIPVSYFLGNLLYFYNKIPLILYPILSKVFSFENKNSFLLFIISIIVGNPTSTYLITSTFEENLISSHEANRLLKFSSFISLFFILFVLEKAISIPLLLGQLLSSFLINRLNKPIKTNNNTVSTNISLTTLINKLPVILLNILSTMILTTVLTIPIKLIFSDSLFFIPTFISFFEITSGINTLTSLYTNILLVFFSSLLISFQGVSITLQVISLLKEKKLNVQSYLKYRLIHAFLATTFSILFYLVFKFFF